MKRKEAMILYAWGCTDYELTIKRLGLLCSLTVDEGTKEMIFRLREKLLLRYTAEEYRRLYGAIRSGRMQKRKHDRSRKVIPFVQRTVVAKGKVS